MPERLVGHNVIQNQARQKQMHAEIKKRPVGLLV